MRLEVGQVYQQIDAPYAAKQETVVVLEIRDEQHQGGLGKPYGDSGCAWPVDLRAPSFATAELHPFDTAILCDAQPYHGDGRWQLIEFVKYEEREDGRWHAVWTGHTRGAAG